ncbi:MAG: NAD(P)/FAD-dependent oxidoreductase [Bacteroides sp.]|nr:NAD(P)/FAD-dependent oxidoreductase [Bacteroides sp.]
MKNIVIIGAGPAGLTAAYRLLKTDGGQGEYNVRIFEESELIGGISRTEQYKGNRIDIGGHRFFSKSREIMDMWREILPPQGAPAKDDIALGRERLYSGGAENDPEKTDNVLLTRSRVSRIYYRRRFFDYPISLKPRTFINMGFVNTVKAGFGYLGSVFRKLPETSLENFYINRFGKPLYQMFFEDYTEKVWGVRPSEIAADWGAQRIKGLSVGKVIKNALMSPFKKAEDKVETSLIESFYYPKYGPGQLWERLAEINTELGAGLEANRRVEKINARDGKVYSVIVKNTDRSSEDFGKCSEEPCDYLISSMPIKDLTAAIDGTPEHIARISSQLPYRDFITVGLLLDKLEIANKTKIKTVNNNVPDCWIYIQDRDVRLGRLQIFNNWSPYMVDDMYGHIWVGLEYFCNEGDDMWNASDEDFISFAIGELEKIGIIKKENVADSYISRVKKAYPAYFGSYSEFDKIREYLDSFSNLFCIGRNGQHRYNNMDHSMMTAIAAAKSITEGIADKSGIWNVNTEKEYHEISENTAGG